MTANGGMRCYQETCHHVYEWFPLEKLWKCSLCKHPMPGQVEKPEAVESRDGTPVKTVGQDPVPYGAVGC